MARERIWSLSWSCPVAGCRNAMATSDGKHEISHSTRVKSWQGFYLVHEWRWSLSICRVWTVNNSMCKMNLQYAKTNKLYSVPESPYDAEANLYARCILALYTACPSAPLVKRDLGVQISQSCYPKVWHTDYLLEPCYISFRYSKVM